jgi:hypothetical protein
VTKLLHQRHLADGWVVSFGIKNYVVALAGARCLIERQLRVLDDFIAVGALLIPDHDPDSGADDVAPPTIKNGSTSVLKRPRTTLSASPGRGQTFGQMDELVASETTQRVRRPRHMFEACENCGQYPVTRQVTVGVVHPFRVRRGPTTAPRPCHFRAPRAGPR